MKLLHRAALSSWLVLAAGPLGSGCFLSIDLDRITDGGGGVPMGPGQPGPGQPGPMPGPNGCPAGMVPVTGATPFCIDNAPVANADYQTFLAKGTDTGGQASGCRFNSSLVPDVWPVGQEAASKPVVSLNWCDAAAYCASVQKRLCGRIGGGAASSDEVVDPSHGQWAAACTQGVISRPAAILEWQDSCVAGHGMSGTNDTCAMLSGGEAGADECNLSSERDRRASSAMDRGFRCCTP